MSIIEIIGFISAAIIGISLGLIGSGGSILTVPVMVYLLHIEPVLATAYSLFVVGVAAFVGGVNYARKKMVNYKTAFVFAIPAFIAVYFTRLVIVPSIPETLINMGDFILKKDMGILLLFAILMVVAAYSMIKNGASQEKIDVTGDETKPVFNFPMIILEGMIVGVVTGLVGAGGGFLIIPALVLFAKLPMKIAVGTSLFIISIKSLIGFMGDVQADQPIDWGFLLTFSTIAAIGIFFGSFLATKIDGKKLQKGFGWFVLAMGIYMIIKELLLNG
ncbi:sulfite exporter TauE/SafE family protein [Membranihabitans maritimus]|uniref:sulfite exporter TauE/SafE family protein n=1 Tax=Membranihabitans maritimus TaxID=2904244 RepID=UPI001F265236|nr:sulfite exporter TauE/SafE family protein [Membranihabitans maritimus]